MTPTLHFFGDAYDADITPGAQPELRVRVRGRDVLALRVASGVDADGRFDVAATALRREVRETAAGLELTWRGETALWPEIVIRARFGREGVRYGYTIRGRGAIDRARFGADGSTRSRAVHRVLWSPEPTGDQTTRFTPGERAVVSVSSDKTFHLGHWFFTPPPFAFALGASDDAWLMAGVLSRAERSNFTELEAAAGDGLSLALVYDGHERVDGEWRSPELAFLPARDPYAGLAAYCELLRAEGLAPSAVREPPPAWWLEPIFCGWGEQCVVADARATDVLTTRAADHATQANYESFVATLEAKGVVPGTLVIDDKWQATYGGNEPDATKWPQLARFIAAQHRRGRRVLLWLKAWDPEGLAADECVLGADGTPIGADPTAPAYVERVRSSVRRMLVELGADGFKLDFTHKIPTAGRTKGGISGLALMHAYVALLHDAMRRVRADALLLGHAVHPAFDGIVDMVRLNDVPRVLGQPKSYLAAMEHRARIARAALPGCPIDTDNWPSPDRASFLEYVREQARIGVPSLYYTTRIRWRSGDEPWVDEELRAEDFAAIRQAWSAYRAARPHLTPVAALA
ncbi:MAG TPA: hypothetical protein VFA01_03675 [Candidatus Dormibacteraeota bacterium]|nr:hypothetical protein [Candidatus Dormibacteraeota bacterium]